MKVQFESPVVGPRISKDQAADTKAIAAVVTGDASSLSFAITHNWGLSQEELDQAVPAFTVEGISIPAPAVLCPAEGGRTPDSIVFNMPAPLLTGDFRVRLTRP